MPRATRVVLLFLLFSTVFGCAEEGAEPLLAPDAGSEKLTDAPGIKVMTQNLYLGVDLDVLFGGDLATAFAQLATSNALDASNPAAGPRRLFDIAWTIAMEAPHLVGLQEVTTYDFTFPDGSTSSLDFLEVIQGWLYYFYLSGQTPYMWTPVMNELFVSPPISLDLPSGTISVVDRDGDAILVRSDVVTLAPPVNATFDAVQNFVVFGTIEFPYPRGFEAVTVEVEGHPLVFVNTHLEVQNFPDVQVAQTGELIAFMDAQTLPVIAVGDFNSAANHDAPEGQKTESYKLFRQAGYADLWMREAHSVAGVTCCQAGDLTNVESEQEQRLDLVLVRWGPAGFGGQAEVEVIGEEPDDRISFTAQDPFTGVTYPLTLWPSDHAGVVATIRPAPGR